MHKSVLISALVTLILTVSLMVYYQRMAARPGKIVIPAGNTYLGRVQ